MLAHIMAELPRLLILGGTAEAVAVAQRAADKYAVYYSLAGRTKTPVIPEGVTVRRGGFGGANALAAWLSRTRIDRVLDATHPFAQNIAKNVEIACRQTQTDRLKLLRPEWKEQPGDIWHNVSDIKDAAQLLENMRKRVFLSIGGQAIDTFSKLKNTSFVVRSIDLPKPSDVPKNIKIITGRGPFAMEQEHKLLVQHSIDVVVSRNSGGYATYGKIAAARQLSIPVIMVGRPHYSLEKIVDSTGSALKWLRITN